MTQALVPALNAFAEHSGLQLLYSVGSNIYDSSRISTYLGEPLTVLGSIRLEY